LSKFAHGLLAALAVAVPIVAMQLPATGASDHRAPLFTPHDRMIIERNELLRESVNSNPRIVRRIVDLIAAQSSYVSAKSTANGQGEEERLAAASRRGDTPVLDPARNPDLEHLSGSSPEATHDLFQLLKKASAKPRPTSPTK
jgi:hypothetical protein